VKSLNALGGLVAAAILWLSVPLLAAIQLVPFVSTGLSSPLFVGHAGDGSNRLFIVERTGTIKVLQPGASTPTLFLDIHTRVVAGNEQGLLGLAFHPFYESNGRFFVYYTEAGGTLVVAEYTVTSDPNIASTVERRLLEIPHPTNLNHNGGMLAFGPDHYLYIGVGDGGSANDPPNNAQNLDVLLGKVLRIDVDAPLGTPYLVPPDNPFVGMVNGRDEIFAYGLRNPWRFSFDRLTGNMWLADVGQGAHEEVDTPLVSGGNYGWRIFEGNFCTNTDASLCNDRSPYIFPIIDYTHSGGRCSITGGYVYRGTQGALPDGTYVYGDYCSGEIFGWDGAPQSPLLDTTMNISSFGEDESGEIYVVNLGGTVSRIVSATPQCTYGITPTSQSFGPAGGTGSVAVTAPAGCGWTAVNNATWLTITGGASGSGNGTVSYSVGPYGGPPKKRNGSLTIAGLTFTVSQTK
jgi:Glucose / Sorbosone dehydrogenase